MKDILYILAVMPIALLMLPFILLTENRDTKSRLTVIQIIVVIIQLVSLIMYTITKG